MNLPSFAPLPTSRRKCWRSSSWSAASRSPSAPCVGCWRAWSGGSAGAVGGASAGRAPFTRPRPYRMNQGPGRTQWPSSRPIWLEPKQAQLTRIDADSPSLVEGFGPHTRASCALRSSLASSGRNSGWTNGGCQSKRSRSTSGSARTPCTRGSRPSGCPGSGSGASGVQDGGGRRVDADRRCRNGRGIRPG
jgi:hypothetical protein